MPAKYQFFKTPSTNSNAGEKPVLHPRLVETRQVGFSEISELIASKSTFTPGDVKGVVKALTDEIAIALRDGNSVDIEGLGTFKVSLSCKPVTDVKEIRAENISFSRVSFRSSHLLRRRLKSMKVERSAEYHKPLSSSPEERMARIMTYFRTHPYVKSSVCMALNKCSRYIAQTDLKTLEEQGKISRLGGRHVSLYVLNKNSETV